jgi:aspartate aminotransferase
MISRRAQAVKPSATLQITAKAKALKAQGIDIVGLGAGEPDFDTPDHIKKALYEAVEEGFVYYTPTPGIPELREALSAKLERENGVSYDPAQEILVTPGAKMALFVAFQAITDPGDEILCPDPYWVSYEPIIQMAGGTPVYVPTYEEDGFRLLPERVEERISEKTKAILLNSPNNPTGAVLNGYDFRAIAALCRERDLLVVSDEIYEKIIYGAKHYTIASFRGMKERTITVNGFSKAYSMTGWRLGYAAGPPEIIRAMARIQGHSTSCATAFVQKAAISALTEYPECVTEMVREFKKRRDALLALLGEIDGVTCSRPKGAFYAFPNFSEYERDSFRLTEYLLEKARVAVVPGAAFGRQGEGYLRLSYATSLEKIEEGVRRIATALKEMRP